MWNKDLFPSRFKPVTLLKIRRIGDWGKRKSFSYVMLSPRPFKLFFVHRSQKIAMINNVFFFFKEIGRGNLTIRMNLQREMRKLGRVFLFTILE